MKRFFRIFLIMVLLIIGSMAVIPIFFEDEIIARAKEEANQNLQATVDFEDVSINLFSHFPNFQFAVSNLTVDGQGAFEGVRLAEVGHFDLELDLWSVLSGSQIQIEGISLSDTRLNVQVNESGQANYDISLPAENPQTEEKAQTNTAYTLRLQYYALENFNLVYNDLPLATRLELKNLNHRGSGDLTEEMVTLATHTRADAFTLEYEGTRYFDRTSLHADMDLRYRASDTRLEFDQDQLFLNDFPLTLDGFFAMPNDEDITMDLSYGSPGATFKQLLSLIPAVYSADFAELESSGELEFNGYARGTYNAESYPAFGLNLIVENGQFRYPDLPAGVNQVYIDMAVESKTNQLDGLELHLAQAKAQIADNPVALSLHLAHPMSNPTYDFKMKGRLNLASLNQIVPLQGMVYQGTLDADFSTIGNMKDIENENYENIEAQGFITAQQLAFSGDSLPLPVRIDTAHLSLRPEQASLSALQMQVGGSDFAANGQIDNLVGYALQDDLLSGSFSLYSKRINLNELSGAGDEGDTQKETQVTDSSALAVVRVPQNLHFIITARIDELLYDELDIRNTEGKITVKEGVAALENLSMEMLEGSLTLNGFYNSVPPAPAVDFQFAIDGFSFSESFEKLTTVRKLAPIMKSTTGKYSTGFTFSSFLNPDMSPDLATASGAGSLVTTALETSPKVTRELAATLQNPGLASLKLNKTEVQFTIENGRLEVAPFDIKAGSIRATVQGSSGLDQSLDYVMDLEIPAGKIGVQNLLSNFGGSQNDAVPLTVNIGGTTKDPKVSTSLGDLKNRAGEALKSRAKEEVTQAKEKVEAQVDKAREKALAEATAQGDALVAAAEKRADQIRAQGQAAAQKIRGETDDKAQKIMDEAGNNPLKKAVAQKAADKARKEGYAKAQQAEDAANRQADQVVAEARQKRQQLIDEATQKTERP